MSDKPKAIFISVDQLCIGIYVCLDLGWLQHSFPMNSFKVKSAEQIAAIRQLGLTEIRVDPARSDCRPLPAVPDAGPQPPVEIEQSAEEIALIEAKKARVERLADLRETTSQCEKQLAEAAGVLKQINANVFSRPQAAHQAADELVLTMLDSLLTDKDIAIHLMNDKLSGEDMYFHSMNVTVLAMMLAREMGMSGAEIKHIGVGCLFHDIGKVEIPDRISHKTEPLTRPEQNILQQHCHFGSIIAEKLGLSKESREIIMQHHEHMDGSGYPKQLKGEKISRLARLVAIVNAYDNLCNQPNPAHSLSPYEALSYMFAQQRKLYDADQLNMFIRCMGVYPPGTIVRLSNEVMGMVVSVNSSKPLRPNVLIYDPDVPKKEAIIIDLLNEPDISVGSSLKPAQLPREVYEYLSPRKRMTYFYDTPKAGPPTHS